MTRQNTAAERGAPRRAPRGRARSAALLLLSLAALLAVSSLCPGEAMAQSCVSCTDDSGPGPRPSPQPSPAPSAGSSQQSPPLSESLARITVNSRKFLTELSESLVDSFRAPVTYLAAVFGAVLIGVTMTQLPWQSDTGIKLLFGLLRISIFCGLFFMITPLFAKFDTLISTDGSTTLDEGRLPADDPTPDANPCPELTTTGEAKEPVDSRGRVVLDMAEKVQMSRTCFEHSYYRFTNRYFKEGRPPGGASESVGRVWDMSKPWYQNVDRVVSPNDWDPTRMFTFITIARGLLSLTELAVGMLWAFVKVALFLFAPVALAAGINQKTAERITYPYLQGLVVFYAVWPPVADVIRFASYRACTMTLESFMKPVVTEGTTAIGNPVSITQVGSIDAYAVMAGIAAMLVCTLMQFGSPFLAYKFWNGQIFEAVTSQASGWIANITGTVAEAYGARVAAELDNAARSLEIRGNYESQIIRADHQREASQLGYLANRRMGEASADSQKIAGSASANAALIQGHLSNEATRDLNVNLTTTQTGQAVAQNEIGRAQQLGATLTNRDQRVGELNNRRNWGIADTVVGTTAGATKDAGGAVPGPLGAGVKAGSTVVEGGVRAGVIIPGQYGGLKDIQKTASEKMMAITNQTADATRDNLKVGLTGGTTITGEQVVGQVPAWEQFKRQSDAAVEAGYEGQMGGVENSYRVTMRGVREAYGLNMKAAETMYQGDVQAAQVMRGASLEAANMHRVASIIQQVSRDFDRKLEQAITVRL